LYPKITIITPSYNQGNYIEQTILSVLDQNYPNLEYIVIDGGSTDNTVDILKKYSHRIHYWISEPDKGQTDAINKGFQRATGDIINWLNSDDYYETGCLFKIAKSFEDPEIKAVTTVVRNFEEGGENWDEITTNYGDNVLLLTKGFNNQPGTFFRKEIWQRYFPLPSQLHYTMDQYLWFCYWLEHSADSFKVENYITTFFRRHINSKTTGSANSTIFNHLGKAFFNEHNLLFWSFFFGKDTEKSGVVSSYFWDDFDYKSKQVSFPKDINMKETQVNQIFQLYLFQLLKEDYRLGFFHRLKTNLQYLDSTLFSISDHRVIKRMRISTWSPRTIKTYRRIYWKLKQI
jgi:glycosyltransferase involved in cell wall biosynthesis